MKKQLWTAALVAALGLAVPVRGRGQMKDDVKDSATETKAEVKKGARDLKPGDKTAGDRVEDAKDTTKATGAKVKKKARKAKNKTKAVVHDATR